jgi:glycosyltransferase involved in cell wall biosynthesis
MIKVKFFPLQAHSLAFGGFEIQMLTLLDNLQQFSTSDFEVSKIDVWSRNSDYNIAHFWGLEPANLNNIVWAKNNGKKIVITVLLSYYERIISLLYDKISKYIGIKKIQLEILKLVDAVVVVNDLQKKVAHNIFNIEKEKIFLIPNIVHENFIKEAISVTHEENYILCTGNICKRKNQVNLARACVMVNAELVLVGKVLPGEEDYGRELEIIVKNSDKIKWIKGLPENSRELVEMVKKCRVFALLSKSETQPISILEAISMNKQLLLSDRKYSYQSYFLNALKVDPDNVHSIKHGIKKIFEDSINFRANPKFLEEFQGNYVAEKYIDVYKSIL